MTRVLQWARTEAEAKRMQAEGWIVPEQAVTHHTRWSILLEWPGPGDPPGLDAAPPQAADG